jgi:hypothetical protein
MVGSRQFERWNPLSRASTRRSRSNGPRLDGLELNLPASEVKGHIVVTEPTTVRLPGAADESERELVRGPGAHTVKQAFPVDANSGNLCAPRAERATRYPGRTHRIARQARHIWRRPAYSTGSEAYDAVGVGDEARHRAASPTSANRRQIIFGDRTGPPRLPSNEHLYRSVARLCHQFADRRVAEPLGVHRRGVDSTLRTRPRPQRE